MELHARSTLKSFFIPSRKSTASASPNLDLSYGGLTKSKDGKETLALVFNHRHPPSPLKEGKDGHPPTFESSTLPPTIHDAPDSEAFRIEIPPESFFPNRTSDFLQQRPYTLEDFPYEPPSEPPPSFSALPPSIHDAANSKAFRNEISFFPNHPAELLRKKPNTLKDSPYTPTPWTANGEMNLPINGSRMEVAAYQAFLNARDSRTNPHKSLDRVLEGLRMAAYFDDENAMDIGKQSILAQGWKIKKLKEALKDKPEDLRYELLGSVPGGSWINAAGERVQSQFVPKLGPQIERAASVGGLKALYKNAESKKCRDFFVDSAKLGHLETIKSMVANGVDFQAEKDFAIRWAARNGHLEVVRFLFEKGANIRADKDIAIQLAASHGHLDIVRFLHEKGADFRANNNSGIQWAADHGHLEVVRFLVENGADFRANNNSGIQWAARNGHLDVVRFLVEKGANWRAGNHSAIRWAARNHQWEVVQFLQDLEASNPE